MRTTIQGQKSVVRKYEHEPLIAPLAYFKRTIEAFYETILHMLFTASTGRRSFDDGAFGILFIFSFLILCILTFYLKEQEILIFGCSAIILLIDRYSSRLHYLSLDPRRHTLLKVREQTTVFEEVFKQKLLRREFFSNRVLSHISIDRFEVLGGAFQERLVVLWRVSLHLMEQDAPIAFHYSEEISSAFRKAIEIAESYSPQIHVSFTDSLGFGHYISTPLYEPEKAFFLKRCRHTVQFENQCPDQWIIRSQWCFESYLRMALEIVKSILFAIALVLIVNLMGGLGGIAIRIIQGGGIAAIAAASSAFKGALLPSQNLTELLEITVISLTMLSRQLNISMVEEITISKDSFEYYLNGDLLGKMKTGDIKSIFLVEQPEPVLLITDQTQFIQIPGLQTIEEFKAFLYRMSESMEHFC